MTTTTTPNGTIHTGADSAPAFSETERLHATRLQLYLWGQKLELLDRRLATRASERDSERWRPRLKELRREQRELAHRFRRVGEQLESVESDGELPERYTRFRSEARSVYDALVA